jgi:serine/threonine protein kinase
LGQYRVLRVLGEGAMGVVFAAEDTVLGRVVAVKVMQPALAAHELARQRFLLEARAAAAIQDDHVVTIHQVSETVVRGASVPYLVMPLLEGETLLGRLQRQNGPLPLAEVLRIGREMALGLAAAHREHLIHRDVKPANVWLEGEKRRVKLLDFGLVREVDQQLTMTGVILGTPAYMAPEQASLASKDLDARCDLFSLGVVLYEMATGQLPFQSENPYQLLFKADPPRSPAELNRKLPAELSALILRLVSHDRRHRPGSAEDVAGALERIQRAVEPRSAGGSGTKPSLLWPWAAMVLACAVAFAVLVWPLVNPVRPPGPGGGTANGNPTEPDPKDKPAAALRVEFENSIKMKLRLVEKGEFWMGSSQKEWQQAAEEAGGEDQLHKESREHPVSIKHAFYMGVYPVTQAEYEAIMKENRSKHRPEVIPVKDTSRYPVETVSWNDAREFCRRLSLLDLDVMNSVGGVEYDLPTEAEREYACRAGTRTPFSVPEGARREDYMWCNDNSDGMTHEVGSKKANPWGFFDMHGNVSQWCRDEDDVHAFCRGGSCVRKPVLCRSAARARADKRFGDAYIGFRVVLRLGPQPAR